MIIIDKLFIEREEQESEPPSTSLYKQPERLVLPRRYQNQLTDLEMENIQFSSLIRKLTQP
jgi:hypothetical protein